MNFKTCNYKDEDDYWRLRAFLREVFLLNGRRETSWQTSRLDYWRYFGNPEIEHYPLSQAITYWETEDQRIVAMMCPENRGHAHLHVHPVARTAELETMMIETAEHCLREPDNHSGNHSITIWAHRDDELRTGLLEGLNYKRGDWPEHQFGRSLDIPIPDDLPARGYTVRSLGDCNELPARAWLSWRVFHPDEPDSNYRGWKWYKSIQRCPLYRRDLDLVAVTTDGEMAAFTTVWYDDVTRTGYFEPVGTSPFHQRRGLARAIMTEGLRRLKALGGVYVTVSGYSEGAINLYSSVMEPESRPYERWTLTLPR